MADYSNNLNSYVNNNINGSIGLLPYGQENNNFQMNNCILNLINIYLLNSIGDILNNQNANQSLSTNSNNRFQNMGAKLNTIQNMFFNNHPSGINLANNNNLFNNQANNNAGTATDLGYLDYYDQNNPNYQSNPINSNNNNNNNNTNPNPNGTLNQMNQEINNNMNQILNGNINNTFNNNNNPLDTQNLKKKNIMEAIQQQLQSNKNSKMQELVKKKMEDQKYLSEMDTYNPFGRNGAGAPLRDNSGKIITRRRALISDNKKLNDSIGNIKDDSVGAGINNPQLNNLISNLTQKISAYGTENIGINNVPRYNSARYPV